MGDGLAVFRDAEINLIGPTPPTVSSTTHRRLVLIRQILGSVTQFEKAMLVAKLRGARERKKAVTGKCGGRMNYVERHAAMVAMAKKLAPYPVNGRKRSLREIAADLEVAGHVAASGKQFGAAIARMIAA